MQRALVGSDLLERREELGRVPGQIEFHIVAPTEVLELRSGHGSKESLVVVPERINDEPTDLPTTTLWNVVGRLGKHVENQEPRCLHFVGY